LPAWLTSKALLTWIPIPKSGLGIADSPQLIADLHAAGLVNADGSPTIWGQVPLIANYSGGALNKATSELLITGGGGAGNWGANNIFGITLSDDAPSWHVAVPSSPTSLLNYPPDTDTEYIHGDGVTHNTGHSLWGPQFLDLKNKFCHVTNTSVWYYDAGSYNGVDTVDFSVARTSRTWDPAGTNPRCPVTANSMGNQYLWVCKDPATENIYVGSGSGIYKRAIADGSWTLWSSSTGDGAAAVGLGVILNITHGSYPTAYSINLATGLASSVTLVNMPTFPSGIGPRAMGFDFDPILGAWIMFIKDGNLYKIAQTDATHYTCSNMGISGTVTMAEDVGPGSGPYNRFRYVPNLKGFVLLPDGHSQTYFVRTA
jgi:hypothetical protein